MSLQNMVGNILSHHSILIIVSVLLVSFLLPVQAQGYVVDLELGGEGAIGWEIDNIVPGDSGTKTIELNNSGSSDGFVNIWIGEINETDRGGDGGSLGKYLLLNLSGERMETNMSFPSTIDGFPQNSSDLKYINITHIGTGEVISLDFDWEFQMTNTSQNEVQGDQLSFNIYFMLEGLPSSEGEFHRTNDDDALLNITDPAEKCELTASDGSASKETGLDGSYDDLIINDNDKKKTYITGSLLLILTGTILFAGTKFLPLLIYSNKQLAVGSNHLIEIIGMDGFGSLFSSVNNVVMSRNTFNRLNSTGLVDSMNEMLEDGSIKVIDTDEDVVKDIMGKYGLNSEDADILATASISSVKEVFITSAEVEKAVNKMGLKPVYLSDLKMDHKK